MPDSAPSIVASRGRGARHWALRLIAAVGFGLMLGACSKCDVPTWQHSSSGMTPAACHDGPPLQ